MANQEMEKGNFENALEHYTNAAFYAEDDHKIYSNRSLAFLHLKKYENALE